MKHRILGFNLQATPKTVWRFLKIEAEDGLSGWGEYTIAAPEAELEAAFRRLMHEANDSDFQLEGPRRGPHMLDQPVRSALYTALDQAVFDIHARRQNRKLVQILDPDTANDRVSLYANINRSVVARGPDAFAARALEAKAGGFSAVKMAPFDDLAPQTCATPEGRRLLAAGRDRIQAVRDAIGPEMSLMVDCHWRFDEKTAFEALGFLTQAGVSWYECPLAETGETIPPLKRLRAEANDRGMRLAGCEKFTGWKEFQPFVENQVYDVIMPDAKYAGGMREIMEVGRRAREQGVAVSLHNPSGPVAHAVSLHVAAALDNGMPLEFQFNETPLFDEIADGTIPPRTGVSVLPDGPGIGIGLLQDRLTHLTP